MAIITTAECKTLLQITVSTYDTLIAALIPIVQDEIVTYCNNPFHKTDVYITASTISFADDDPDTINDSASGFVTADFTSDIDIHVEDSANNDGIFHVDTAAAGTLTLASGETLVVEAVGEGVTITRVVFYKALKMVCSEMVNYRMQKANLTGVKSQKLADYSFTLASETGGGYTKGIYNQLTVFRKPNWR